MVSEKSLRRWTNAELERVRKVWAVVSFWSVVELRERICGASVGEFRAGGFWRCGACQGLRERQEARLAGVVILELADGTFSRA